MRFEILILISILIIIILIIVLYFKIDCHCNNEKYSEPIKFRSVPNHYPRSTGYSVSNHYPQLSGNDNILWTIKDQAIISITDSKPLKGVSLSGTEFKPNLSEYFGTSANMEKLFQFLNNNFKAKIIRIPICMSRYDLDKEYPIFIDDLVTIINKNNMIAIIDAHVWRHDWSLDPGGSCPSNDQTGMTVDGVITNTTLFTNLKRVWTNISMKYKNNPNVFFELFNEPRFEANYTDPKEMDWKQWYDVLYGFAYTIRNIAPKNVLIVGGLNWSYTFFVHPENKSFKTDFNGDYDNLYLPFTKLENVVFNIHPYQHATCCGTVTNDTQDDLSLKDPYFNTYCSYFYDKKENKPVFFDYSTWAEKGKTDYVNTKLYPIDKYTGKEIMCTGPGLSSSDQDKLPPCKWIDYDIIDGQKGYCSGDVYVCKQYTNEIDCNNNKIPAGWDKNLFMKKYGPLFMTEFGSYDCSTPFVNELLKWAQKNKVGWTVWALWPGDMGGPGTSGNCGFPSFIRETPDQTLMCGDDCSQIIKPLGKYGDLIISFMRDVSHHCSQCNHHH